MPQKGGLKYTIKDWPEAERPREQLARRGPDDLTNAQLLAILISSGAAGRSAVAVGQELVTRFGTLQQLEGRTIRELSQTKGIGPAKAIKIQAALELGRRMMAEPAGGRLKIREPADVYQHFGLRFQRLRQEVFWVLLLNSQHEVLHQIEVSRGSVNASLVHPREVFRPAVLEASAAVLFVHNHPSGNPSPSQEDQQLTGQLREAGEILGIDVLDHIIVGDGGRFYSFAEHSWT